ncbi:MAG TPA: competence/damage-inducible protein A [Candidatus Caccousia avistercoris]|nr:competence/damage-inducible protein A [Candidatus Caccousia avistercoris]
MKAELISVGTELLLGHTVNTDAAYTARALSAIGIDVLHVCTVGDNPGRLEEALRTALGRSGLVVLTGGLGPTNDDLTKETAARVCGKRLVPHEESRRRIAEYFKNRECSQNQWKQADLPEGCHVFPNNHGTAPGCVFQAEGGQYVALLPGPPSELEPMVRDSLIPWLAGLSQGVIVSRMVRTFGIGEGSAAQRLADLMESANPTAAPYAKDCEMFVRVTAKGETEEAAQALCAPLVEEIRRRLGDYVYAVNGDGTSPSCLEHTVVGLLAEKGMTLATAESCTGGLIAKRITDVPGASEVFHLGAVTYANEAKERLLGVPAELLEQYGAVSEPVARAMAEGVRRLAGSSIGVGVTGIAGPGGGTPEKPVGLVYIGVCDGTRTLVHRMDPGVRQKGREWTRFRAASTALDLVRRLLTGAPVEYERI